MNPNPIMGIADRRATILNCRSVGSGGGSGTAVVEAVVSLGVAEEDSRRLEEENRRGERRFMVRLLLLVVHL